MMNRIFTYSILAVVVLLGYFLFFMPTVYAEGVEGNVFPGLLEWTKLTDPDIIADIKTTLSNKAGIYRFTCLDTGGTYIGSSADLAVRFNDHINYDLKSNIILQRSMNKHGLESFSFSIIEFCDRAVLLEREQVWLNFMFSTFASALIYNLARDALAPFTVVRILQRPKQLFLRLLKVLLNLQRLKQL